MGDEVAIGVCGAFPLPTSSRARSFEARACGAQTKVGPNRFRIDFFANVRPPISHDKTANSLERALFTVVQIDVTFLVPKLYQPNKAAGSWCLGALIVRFLHMLYRTAGKQLKRQHGQPTVADRSSSNKRSPLLSTPGPIPSPPQQGRPGPPLAASGDSFLLARIGCGEATIIWKPAQMQYQRPLLLCPAEEAALSLIQRLHSDNNSDDERTSCKQKIHDIAAPGNAVGGNSGHSGPLKGVEEHVKKMQALHSNSGSIDNASAVVHIFPGVQLRI
ncbi:hypothetical protein THAOC_34075 [Thalassiosira oceanica]|uniref:Uncharacterized protein n=1 Tax=Thalassiosira oceanica TaxID=159749 RepID=K0R349_THAOC|nr:hypothetical protein THAOC_34075 [Thalassiosira oceanica]|eukprot:EJK47223.1 hypothetical protein THAOC_34075 [Thalassiosira oceanica]